MSGRSPLAGDGSFSGQIYFDFGGYSLCAIGLALCFGFAFPDNFRFPFRAPSMEAVAQVLSGLARFDIPPKLDTAATAVCLFSIGAMLGWQLRLRDSSLEEQFAGLGSIVQTAALACCLVGIFLCSGGDGHAFIYFQF